MASTESHFFPRRLELTDTTGMVDAELHTAGGSAPTVMSTATGDPTRVVIRLRLEDRERRGVATAMSTPASARHSRAYGDEPTEDVVGQLGAVLQKLAAWTIGWVKFSATDCSQRSAAAGPRAMLPTIETALKG